MHRALLSLLVAGVLFAAPAVVVAHGGDAQADFVVGDTSFPDDVPAALRGALDGMVAEARREGYAVKVALVGDVFDVERRREWFYDPQAYADFLSGLLPPGERVLTVHPSGFGGNALGEGPAVAISALPYPEVASLDELARRAMRGVATLTAAHGTPVALPAIATRPPAADDSRSGGGPPMWLIVLVPAGVVAGGIAVLGRLTRRAP